MQLRKQYRRLALRGAFDKADQAVRAGRYKAATFRTTRNGGMVFKLSTVWPK